MPSDILPEDAGFEVRDMLPLMREVFSRGVTFRLYPRGKSMLPTLHEGIDYVDLAEATQEDIRPGRMLLYQRENGAFVLHRVVAVKGDTFTARGDNQYYDEEGLLFSQVIAAVVSYTHNGKAVTCLSRAENAYRRRRRLTYPIRRTVRRGKNFIRRIFHRGK